MVPTSATRPSTAPTPSRLRQAGTTCTSRSLPEASEPGYTDAWYARIVADGENAEHYAAPASVDLGDELNSAKLRVLYKQPRGQ